VKGPLPPRTKNTFWRDAEQTPFSGVICDRRVVVVVVVDDRGHEAIASIRLQVTLPSVSPSASYLPPSASASALLLTPGRVGKIRGRGDAWEPMPTGDSGRAEGLSSPRDALTATTNPTERFTRRALPRGD